MKADGTDIMIGTVAQVKEDIWIAGGTGMLKNLGIGRETGIVTGKGIEGIEVGADTMLEEGVP